MRTTLLPALLLTACVDQPKESAAPNAVECDPGDYPAAYELTDAVDIQRDERGIPHIYARNDADAFYASGYQVATDRLFELDTFIRAARGTLAEVRGEEELDSDLTARTFDFGRYACDSLAWIAKDRPDDLTLVIAYVSGVNARIAEVRAGEAPLPWGFGPDELDYLPEPMELTDVVRIGQRVNLGYSSTIEYDILYSLLTRLVPDYELIPIFAPGADRFIAADEAPRGAARPATAAAPPLDWTPAEAEAFLAGVKKIRAFTYPGEGSNNWAVNGDTTDNGRPYIANDPHSSFHDPNTLYTQHISSVDGGGAFDVIGFSFLGIPGVQLGHTGTLAWAATTHFADQTDIFDVAVTDGVADMGGTDVPVSERTELIRVRMADGSLEDRAFTVQDIDGYGVILPDELLPVPKSLFAGGSVMVAWVGFAPTNELLIYLDMDRADDLDAFQAAVDHQLVGMHNWMGATADGIRYHTHGLIPDRGPVETRPAANRVLDASDASTLWTGEYLTEDRFPHLDGDRPFMVSANNDPWGHTADNDPLNDTFYYGSFYSPSFRAERIATELERMQSEGPVTAADMASLQLDTHSAVADALIPILEAAAATIDTDEELATYRGREDIFAAVDRLVGWDRHMVRSSSEAALFRVWTGHLAKRTLSSDLSLLFVPVEEASPVTIAKVNMIVHQQAIESVLDGRGAYDLLGALADALEWNADQAAAAGLTELTWADLHRVAVHPTWGDTEYLSVDGDESTPNVSGCVFWRSISAPEEHCDGDEGPIFRTVTGFAEDGVPETTFSVPYGPDGDVEEWREGVYDALSFRRADVDARTVETITLTPD